MEATKKFFMECHLAGRMYHDADEVWDKLKVGTLLQLVLDTDNRFDPNAVAVVYNDIEMDDDDVFLIGYIPRSDNETIAAFLEMGWNDAFECRISRINADAHPENQIRLTIKIKRNKK
ncbi:MAG: HIRAN domain-containing protein [Muribaculaceae bacterium]|nr:HIRAN domain-containing protein [Muribaculaceae bacterium]